MNVAGLVRGNQVGDCRKVGRARLLCYKPCSVTAPPLSPNQWPHNGPVCLGFVVREPGLGRLTEEPSGTRRSWRTGGLFNATSSVISKDLSSNKGLEHKGGSLYTFIFVYVALFCACCPLCRRENLEWDRDQDWDSLTGLVSHLRKQIPLIT